MNNPRLAKTFSKNGRSPLHTACLHGRTEAVQLILNASPDLALSKDSCGSLPILEAVKGGHKEILNNLVNIDPKSMYVQDMMGRHCLHMAAQSGHQSLLEHLVSHHGMDPNDPCSPTSPLHWAAKEGQAKAISELLKLGANPSATDSANRIPLTLAIGGQHVEAADVLIKQDPKKPFDLTVLHLARSAPMKDLLTNTFQTQWNLTLFLPGTH